MMINHNVTKKEQGSALIIIFITIGLFAALSFAYSRMGSGNNKLMSSGQAKIAATEILDHAKDIERAVNRLMLRGCSEDDISFVNSVVSGYNHTPVAPDGCKIFNSLGGGITYSKPDDSWLDTSLSGENSYGDWCFYGEHLSGVGSSSNADLMVWVPYIKKDLCLEINKKLSVPEYSGNPPQESDDVHMCSKYTGSSSLLGNTLSGALGFRGELSACIEGGSGGGSNQIGRYYFYHVIIPR